MTATKELLEALHGVVADELKRRIEAGEATAADISAAIKFLKDNGIEAIGGKNPNVASLASTMPNLADMEDEFTPTVPN